MQMHSRGHGLKGFTGQGVKMREKWEQASGLLGCLHNILRKPILDMMGIQKKGGKLENASDSLQFIL